MKQRICQITGIVLMVSMFTSCMFFSPRQEVLPPVETEEEPVSIYAQAENWAELPEEILHEADLFYIYPRLTLLEQEAEIEEGPVPDEGPDPSPLEAALEPNDYVKTPEQEQALRFYIASQTGPFRRSCNVFIPYHTQYEALSNRFYAPKSTDDKVRKVSLPSVIDSFSWYMENLNDGRPFILAGLGTGSQLLLLLMEELFDQEELQQKLIAAYLPGYSVTEGDLEAYPHLRFSQRSDDLGVIVSWNTEGEALIYDNPVTEEDALAVNPLTWDRREDFVSRIKNHGARFFDSEGEQVIEIDRFTSAQIIPERRAVSAFEPDPRFYLIEDQEVVPRAVYNHQEYMFFFDNIMKNAEERIEAYAEIYVPSVYPVFD